MQLHKFYHKPTKREVLDVWRHAKRNGDIPASWSCAACGRLEQVWGGWVITTKKEPRWATRKN